jgi:transcriptional regulator with XRE-family HTH domain
MINDALRMIRVFHDIPQKELAARLKIAPSYLSEIESGKKQPTLQLLETYADEFKMPLSSIMFFSEKMEDGTRNRLRLNISNKVLALLKFIAARAEQAG